MTTLIPNDWSIFSLKRMVLKFPGRAPIAPKRAFFKPFDHTANTDKFCQIGLEAIRQWVNSVQFGQGVGVSILAQIVANRDLAAEPIAAAFHRQLVQVVRISLDQNGHIQPGEFDGIRHALFIAKVGQDNEDPIDLFGILLEQLSTDFGVVQVSTPPSLVALSSRMTASISISLKSLRISCASFSHQIDQERNHDFQQLHPGLLLPLCFSSILD